jgi:hypothetical protein
MLVVSDSEIIEVRKRECVRVTRMRSVSFFASMSHVDGSELASMNLDLKMWSGCRGYVILT